MDEKVPDIRYELAVEYEQSVLEAVNAGDSLPLPRDAFFAGFDMRGKLEKRVSEALLDQARREGFRAGRRSKEGCVVNIDYGRNGLGAFEYLTEDDYIESLKEEEK